jgi:hypothetical protein
MLAWSDPEWNGLIGLELETVPSIRYWPWAIIQSLWFYCNKDLRGMGVPNLSLRRFMNIAG